MENYKTLKVKFKYTPKGYRGMGILLKDGCGAETGMSLSHDDQKEEFSMSNHLWQQQKFTELNMWNYPEL
jgi:hypothetical protein